MEYSRALFIGQAVGAKNASKTKSNEAKSVAFPQTHKSQHRINSISFGFPLREPNLVNKPVKPLSNGPHKKITH